MTPLAAATLFPIPPNAEFDVTLSRAWLTDIQRAQAGNEVRAAIRSVPVRRLEYTASLARVPRLEGFRTVWLGATEPLRYLVPLWPESSVATAFPDSSTITADTTFRAFVAGGQALLFRRGLTTAALDTYELATINTLATGSITTVDPTSIDWAAFPAGSVHVIPVIGAWLTPPTKDQLTGISANVPLAFDEELPGVAGLDVDVGDSVTAEGITITTTIDEAGEGLGGRKYATISAHVFDAAGQRIAGPELTWVVVSTGDVAVTDPGVRISYPQNRQQFHMEFSGGGDTQFHVTVSYGAVSTDRFLNGVG